MFHSHVFSSLILTFQLETHAHMYSISLTLPGPFLSTLVQSEYNCLNKVYKKMLLSQWRKYAARLSIQKRLQDWRRKDEKEARIRISCFYCKCHLFNLLKENLRLKKYEIYFVRISNKLSSNISLSNSWLSDSFIWCVHREKVLVPLKICSL